MLEIDSDLLSELVEDRVGRVSIIGDNIYYDLVKYRKGDNNYDKWVYGTTQINAYLLAFDSGIQWAKDMGYTLLYYEPCTYIVPNNTDIADIDFLTCNNAFGNSPHESILKACAFILLKHKTDN